MPAISGERTPRDRAEPGPAYRWIALSNTTLGTLMATINGSIILIALPDIFRGIGVNPLLPGNTSLLLWLIIGYLLVTAVLVVTFGRLGDMFGRVRIYNLGFAVFSAFSILLALTWLHGTAAALWLIAMRILQAVGGANPGLLRRQPGQPAGRTWPRRADVHLDHLAAGHLPAPARLRLQPDPAVGRHRHAPAHGRVPDRRASLRRTV
jgi:hypothetical protein